MPEKLRILILKQILESEGQNLASYAPYHIAAISGTVVSDKINQGIKGLLKDAVRNSPPYVLDQIPNT